MASPAVGPTVQRTIDGVLVRGVDVGPETRCGHYDGERDVIALRFPCCDDYYPCFECHEAVADHERSVWPGDAAAVPAVLCGRCGTELAIEAYLRADHACPDCGAAFNPGCAAHYDRYFAPELYEA